MKSGMIVKKELILTKEELQVALESYLNIEGISQIYTEGGILNPFKLRIIYYETLKPNKTQNKGGKK